MTATLSPHCECKVTNEQMQEMQKTDVRGTGGIDPVIALTEITVFKLKPFQATKH